MNSWLSVTLTCAVLAARADISAAQTRPIPDNPPLAQTSLAFNPKTRCPDLRIADEGTLAVVVFWVPRSGIPSQITIKSSSGSNALDSAAVSCVSKLRFAPVTRLGDGEPLDSWQQIAWRWAERGNPDPDRAGMAAQSPLSAAAGQAAEPVAAAPNPIAAERRQNDSRGHPDSVTVHVCVDETGKLKQAPTIVHSSGNAGLDEAAVKIAASGSAYYRPGTSSVGVPMSGCAQLAIKFETNQ
jgi:TonB family protein